MQHALRRHVAALVIVVVLGCGLSLIPAASSPAVAAAPSSTGLYPYPMLWPRLAARPFSCLWHSSACAQWKEYTTVFDSIAEGGTAGSWYRWSDARHAAYAVTTYAIGRHNTDAEFIADLVGGPTGMCGFHARIQLLQLLNHLRSMRNFSHMMGAVLRRGLGRAGTYGKYTYQRSATILLKAATQYALGDYANQETTGLLAGLWTEGCG